MKCKLKKSWIKAELEHAHNFPKNLQLPIAKKIACDHVKELGPKYYSELFKIERKLKRR
jgi:hypothetical protein